MKKWCILNLSLCLVMVLSVCILLSGLLVSKSEAYGSQISGQWKMVANRDYNFDLNLRQQGNQITGTMTRTNGSEPVDRITGRVSDSGTIEFTRQRAGAWKQNYQGEISQDGRQLIMRGNFNHDGSGSYPWSAAK